MPDDLRVVLHNGSDPPARVVLHGVSAERLRAVQEAEIPVEYHVQTSTGETIAVPASKLALPPEARTYA